MPEVPESFFRRVNGRRPLCPSGPLPTLSDNALAAERHQDALLLQRLAHPLRDYGRIVADSERHSALESMRTRDEDAEPTIEQIGGDPRFVRSLSVPAAVDHGGLNALATGTGHALP